MRVERTIRTLGIETSCDETAAAIVDVRGHRRAGFSFDVRSNVIASQVALHGRTSGIVPEVAAREHVKRIIPVVEQALRSAAGRRLPATRRGRREALGAGGWELGAAIDAIAVTAGPGLVTSLAVGVETARSLAFAWEKPLIAVNHIEGHVVSALLSPVHGISFPALALIVSGGHTELLLMRTWGAYRCLGATRDDAAGEAFDKVGKLLGLPYPGGPAVARAAERGDPQAFDFPRGMIGSGDFDFSFSGLKTAVRYELERLTMQRRPPPHTPPPSGKGGNEKSFLPFRVGGGARGGGTLTSDLCASFQVAVVDVLVAKTIAAAQRERVRTVLLGGGVAANTALRKELGDAVRTRLPDSLFLIPDSSFTGDNAAMIAAAGGARLLLGERTPWDALRVDPNWELGRPSPSRIRG